MTIPEYLLLIGMPLLGGVLALTFKKLSSSNLQLILSFSGAYLIGITFLDLLPGLYHSYSLKIGAFVIAGFVLQIILDQFSKGVEHGHIHADNHMHKWYVLTLMIGLGIHAFLEGIPLSGWELIEHGDHHSHQPLLLSIAVHKVPAAFALASVVLYSGGKIQRVLLVVGIFSLISPAAAFLTELLAQDMLTILENMDLILAVVIGSFLHISTTILFEVGSKVHRFSLFRLVAILVGAGAAIATVA